MNSTRTRRSVILVKIFFMVKIFEAVLFPKAVLLFDVYSKATL